MKLRTVGLLFSLVCAITLGCAKGNAVANEMKVTKNEITAVVKDAVTKEFGALDFGNEKEINADEFGKIFSEKINVGLLKDIEKDPTNYDSIEVSETILSRLGKKEKDVLDEYWRYKDGELSKFEKSFIEVINSGAIKNIEEYKKYVEVEFKEEIEFTKGLDRAYYDKYHPQVSPGDPKSLLTALVCLVPMWVAVLMLSDILVAAGAINIPFVGPAISAAAILCLAVVIVGLIYLAAYILAEVLKCIGDFFGNVIKPMFEGWAMQIKEMVWDNNRTRAYTDVVNRYGTAVQWTDANDMDGDLSKALKLHGAAISVAKVRDKYEHNEELKVYIGKYYDVPNYVDYAAMDSKGIAFSMSDSDQKALEKKGYTIWHLNEYYLELFGYFGYEFRLCSDPNIYFGDGSGYGKELVVLRSLFYVWSPVFFKPFIPAWQIDDILETIV